VQAGAPRSRTLTFGGERNFARQCGSRAQRRRCPRSQRGHTVRRLPASNGLPARALVPRRLARFLQYLANRDFFRTRLLGWLRRVCHLRKRGAAPCEQEAFWMAKSTPAPRVEGHGGLSVKKTCFDEPLRPPEDCPDRAQVRHKPRTPRRTICVRSGRFQTLPGGFARRRRAPLRAAGENFGG